MLDIHSITYLITSIYPLLHIYIFNLLINGYLLNPFI